MEMGYGLVSRPASPQGDSELGQIVYGVAALKVNDGMPELPAEMVAEAVAMLDRSILLVERYIGVAAGLRLRTAADLPPTGRITSEMAIALLNPQDARPEKGSLLQRVWHAKGMLEQLLSEVRD